MALIAALRSGRTFESLILNDTRVNKTRTINADVIEQWLYSQSHTVTQRSFWCLKLTQRRQLEQIRALACSLYAAYCLSANLGCELSGCIQAVADSYRMKCHAQDLRSQVLAMPESTIKLLSVLPLMALLLGELLGAHPVALLLMTQRGWLIAAVGLTCYGVGMVWVLSMIRSVRTAMALSSQSFR